MMTDTSSLNIVKIYVAIAILIAGFVSVFLPFRMKALAERASAVVAATSPAKVSTSATTNFNYNSFQSYGNMFTCGILLSAAMVHQLADSTVTFYEISQQQIKEEEERGGDHDNDTGEEDDDDDMFPWSMFIASCTFVTFVIFEELVHLIFASEDHHHNHHHHHVFLNESKSIDDIKKGEVDEERDNFLDPIGDEDEESVSLIQMTEQCHSKIEKGESNNNNSSSNLSNNLSLSSIRNDDEIIENYGNDRNQSVESSSIHSTTTSFLSSMILMVALSTHSVLAGLALGIGNTAQYLSSTAIAILAHKSFEGFALGSSLVDSSSTTIPSNSSTKRTTNATHMSSFTIMLCVMFSLATPAGIVFGMLMTSISSNGKNSSDVAVEEEVPLLSPKSLAIIQSIIAGTFLYISIVEIGMKELTEPPSSSLTTIERKRNKVLKLFFFALGYSLMSLLALYV